MLTGDTEDPFAGVRDVQAAEAELLRQNNSRLHALINSVRGQPAAKEHTILKEELRRQHADLKKV